MSSNAKGSWLDSSTPLEGNHQSAGQMFGLTRKLMYWIDICYESGILLYCSTELLTNKLDPVRDEGMGDKGCVAQSSDSNRFFTILLLEQKITR